MGSPLSPIIANIVMDELLVNCLDRLTFQMLFIYKYVDDIICAIPANSVEYTLKVFNEYHPDIQFTVEQEDCNNSVPFLDCRIIRSQEQHLITDWFTKKTYTGRYINFFSNHPINQKINTVTTMRNRILKLSNHAFHNVNLKKLLKLYSQTMVIQRNS